MKVTKDVRPLDLAKVQELLDSEWGTSGDLFLALCKLVFPDWDKIKSISGWPRVNERLNKKIFNTMQEIDKRNNPGHFSSTLWLNRGWGCDNSLTSEEISFDFVTVTY